MRLFLAIVVFTLLGVPPADHPLHGQTAGTVSWDLYPDTTPQEMQTLYLYQLLVDTQPRALSPTCTTMGCSALVMGMAFVMGQTYTLSFRVACVATPTVFGTATTPVSYVADGSPLNLPDGPLPPPSNPCKTSTPPPPSPPNMLGPCSYAAPSTPTTFEQRPIGQHMQGYNAVGPAGVINNQADRIRLLKSWGWAVVLAQFVPGVPDRLYLVVECRGL